MTSRRRTSKKEEKWSVTKELQKLAATLDTEWLAVVSRLKIENCGAMSDHFSQESWDLTGGPFDFICEKSWDEMAVSDDPSVRFCDVCQHQVHYCETIVAARHHAQEKHCVAVDLGIIRHKDDINPPLLMMGVPTEEFWENEEKRLKVDEVSLARDRQKKSKD